MRRTTHWRKKFFVLSFYPGIFGPVKWIEVLIKTYCRSSQKNKYQINWKTYHLSQPGGPKKGFGATRFISFDSLSDVLPSRLQTPAIIFRLILHSSICKSPVSTSDTFSVVSAWQATGAEQPPSSWIQIYSKVGTFDIYYIDSLILNNIFNCLY